jgi:hypothetical protein
LSPDTWRLALSKGTESARSELSNVEKFAWLLAYLVLDIWLWKYLALEI